MAKSSKDDERESEGRQKERTIASGGEGWRAEKGVNAVDMRREPLLSWWLARVFPFLLSPFHSQRPSHPSTASRPFLLFKHPSPLIHCHCPFLLFKHPSPFIHCHCPPSFLRRCLPFFAAACHPSFAAACHSSPLLAILPSPLLAILPSPLLAILLSCSRSFPTRDPPLSAILRCYSPSVLTSIVMRSQSFTATTHPSFAAAWPVPTILLSCSRSFRYS